MNVSKEELIENSKNMLLKKSRKALMGNSALIRKEKRSINQHGRAEIIDVLFSAIIFELIIIETGFPGYNTLYLFVLLIFNQIYT